MFVYQLVCLTSILICCTTEPIVLASRANSAGFCKGSTKQFVDLRTWYVTV